MTDKPQRIFLFITGSYTLTHTLKLAMWTNNLKKVARSDWKSEEPCVMAQLGGGLCSPDTCALMY